MLTIFPKFTRMKQLNKAIPLVLLLHTAAVSAADISSLVFFDLNGSTQKAINPAFRVGRAYLDLREKLTDNISFRLTTDAQSSIDGKIEVFLKYAFVSWQTRFGEFMVGSQPTNYFGPLKQTWGLRFIEKFPGNLHGFDDTADLGISLQRVVGSDLLFHAAVFNGSGFKKPENDAYKRMSLLVSKGEQNLSRNTGHNFGLLGSVEPYGDWKDNVYLKYRYGGFVGYANSWLRAGFDLQIEQDAGLNHQERILALYASLKRTEQLTLLGRIDIYDSSVDHPDMREHFVLMGMTYSPAANFQIAPNIKYTFFGTDLLEPYWQGRLSFYFRF